MKNDGGFNSKIFLVCVLNVLTVWAQNAIELDQVLSFTSSNLSTSPLVYSLPESSEALSISVAFCSANLSSQVQIYATNNTSIDTPGPTGGTDVFQVTVEDDGIGSILFQSATSGGYLAIDGSPGDYSFELLVSNTGQSFEVFSALPLLGDTTSNQAIIFSPPFSPAETVPPSFPNYTLPAANISYPPLPSPSDTLNFTLLLTPTSSFPVFGVNTNTLTQGVPMTACALKSFSNETILKGPNDATLVYRDADGWRAQFLVEDLQPLLNYTAFLVQDDLKVSGPIYLATKSASFSCPLVHSLPYCPKLSYAVPLAAPASGAYDAGSIPSNISEPLLSYLTNFTTTLLTFACGRDNYSPLQSCADCQEAYRDWLCAISFPRCSEARLNATELDSVVDGTQSTQGQTVLPALVPQAANTTTRNPYIPPAPMNYSVLLPCLETCNAVDRACPVFLGFTCPSPRFNADASYGVGYVDGGDANGDNWRQGGGMTGTAQDRWGNVWCAGT